MLLSGIIQAGGRYVQGAGEYVAITATAASTSAHLERHLPRWSAAGETWFRSYFSGMVEAMFESSQKRGRRSTPVGGERRITASTDSGVLRAVGQSRAVIVVFVLVIGGFIGACGSSGSQTSQYRSGSRSNASPTSSRPTTATSRQVASGGGSTENAATPSDPCALFGKLLAAAVTEAGVPAQWAPSSGDYSGPAGASARELICAVYLEHPHQTTASLDDQQKVYITLPADQGGGSGCNVGSATTLSAQLGTELSKLSTEAGTVEQCGEANFEGAGGAWRAYIDLSGSWGGDLPENAQGDNPQADQVLAQWLLGIGFSGNSLPKLENHATNAGSALTHLSQAQLDQAITSQPCSLVPKSLVTKWMPAAFNQPPVAFAQTCQYGKIVNGTAAGSVTVSFKAATGPLASQGSAGFSSTHVGALPARIYDDGNGNFIIAVIERGIEVTIEEGANSGSSSVTKGEILGLAGGIAAILH